MLRRNLTILLAVFTQGLVAQAILLPGEIAIQNSKYETGVRRYVQGASIRAPFAKAVTSDKDGQFTLGFAGVQNGTPARLTVEKTGMEVVNTKETQQVILGRAPRITVVMADAQKLAEAQVAYYNIATGSIAKNYERKMRALRDDNVGLEERLAALNTAYGKQLTTLEAAIGLLTDEREQAMDNARELALELASADLDNASQLYIKAFELFKRGQLDSVLMVLGEERLKADYEKVIAEKERTVTALDRENSTIAQLYASYQLKANVLKAQMAYRPCLAVFEQMVVILDRNPEVFPLATEADLQLAIAEVHRSVAEFKPAAVAVGTGLASLEHGASGNEATQAALWNKWGEILTEQDLLDSALKVFEQGRIVLAKVGLTELPVEADLICNIGVAYSMRGEYMEALKVDTQALALRERIFPAGHVDIGLSHVNLANVQGKLGDYPGAVASMTSGLAMLEAGFGPEHPTIAVVQQNLTVCMAALGDLDGAVALAKTALASMVYVLGEDHPNTANCRNTLAYLLLKADRLDEALAEVDIAIPASEKALGPQHAVVIASYNNKAQILFKMGRLDESSAMFRRTLSLNEAAHGPDHPSVAVLCANIAVVLRSNGDLDGALEAIDRSIAVYEKILPKGHASIAMAQVTKATLLELKGEYQPALVLLRSALHDQQAAAGAENRELFNTHCRIGIAHYHMQQMDSASIALHESYRLKANAPSAWYLYKIANDQNDDQQALDWLVNCVRLRTTDRTLKPGERQEGLDALKTLATKLGRTDILDEFNLH